MKKLLFFSFLCVILSGFISCSNDDSYLDYPYDMTCKNRYTGKTDYWYNLQNSGYTADELQSQGWVFFN